MKPQETEVFHTPLVIKHHLVQPICWALDPGPWTLDLELVTFLLSFWRSLFSGKIVTEFLSTVSFVKMRFRATFRDDCTKG